MHTENKKENQPYQIRLPTFITDKEIGLGDVVKQATSSLGIKPCSGCEKRSTILNHLFIFSGKK